MKGKRIVIVSLFFLVVVMSCSSVRSTLTKVETLDGNVYDAIELINAGPHHQLRIAKIENNRFIMYVRVAASGRPGSLIMTIDGERQNLINHNDWELYAVDAQGSGWRGNVLLSENVVTSLLKANSVNIRIVNAWGGPMSRDQGVDISNVLPQLKNFLEQ